VPDHVPADVRRFDPDFWSTFNASPDELAWYYTSVEAVVVERLPESSIATALRRAVEELLAAADTERSAVSSDAPVRN